MLDKRVISAAVALPILIFCLILGGWVFKIGILAVTAIALYEYIHVYKKSDYKVISYVLWLGYLINLITLIYAKSDLYMLPLISLIVILCMSMPVFTQKFNVISSALTAIGYIYIINFFTMLIYIREFPVKGYKLIWLVFIIAWCCDTCAYYSGRFFGKRKLCPLVSPKKTIEGSIGGIAGSVIGVMIWWFINPNIGFAWYQVLILGLIGGAISQLGDLSASVIKRFVNVKDYGNIMPGHGGILDRFDSILFTIPVVYYYIIIFLG